MVSVLFRTSSAGLENSSRFLSRFSGLRSLLYVCTDKLRSCSTMSGNSEAQSVLDYWFEPGKELKYLFNVWFVGGEKQDKELKEKFGPLIEKARNQELKSWTDNAKTALAHIILIDQFCRSVYRGSPKACDCDHISLDIAKKLVAGDKINHKDLNPMERFFVYRPLEHSENLDDQNACCQLYEDMAKEYEGTKWHKFAQNGVSFAKEHREVIKICGRFPKRNVVLGRTNTPEEDELLKNWTFKF